MLVEGPWSVALWFVVPGGRPRQSSLRGGSVRSDGGAELALGAAARLQWLVPAFGYATGTESPSPRGCLVADFMHAGRKS